jgi:hypothetical protein
MSIIASPEADYVTRNEFNAYLALIACGQKNMGKMTFNLIVFLYILI